MATSREYRDFLDDTHMSPDPPDIYDEAESNDVPTDLLDDALPPRYHEPPASSFPAPTTSSYSVSGGSSVDGAGSYVGTMSVGDDSSVARSAMGSIMEMSSTSTSGRIRPYSDDPSRDPNGTYTDVDVAGPDNDRLPPSVSTSRSTRFGIDRRTLTSGGLGFVLGTIIVLMLVLLSNDRTGESRLGAPDSNPIDSHHNIGVAEGAVTQQHGDQKPIIWVPGSGEGGDNSVAGASSGGGAVAPVANNQGGGSMLERPPAASGQDPGFNNAHYDAHEAVSAHESPPPVSMNTANNDGQQQQQQGSAGVDSGVAATSKFQEPTQGEGGAAQVEGESASGSQNDALAPGAEGSSSPGGESAASAAPDQGGESTAAQGESASGESAGQESASASVPATEGGLAAESQATPASAPAPAPEPAPAFPEDGNSDSEHEAADAEEAEAAAASVPAVDLSKVDMSIPFCGGCQFSHKNFLCTNRVDYLMGKYHMTEEESQELLMKQGHCPDTRVPRPPPPAPPLGTLEDCRKRPNPDDPDSLENFCVHCQWKNSRYNCLGRANYLQSTYNTPLIEAAKGLMAQGYCMDLKTEEEKAHLKEQGLDRWCGACPFHTTTCTAYAQMMSNQMPLDDAMRDLMSNGVCMMPPYCDDGEGTSVAMTDNDAAAAAAAAAADGNVQASAKDETVGVPGCVKVTTGSNGGNAGNVNVLVDEGQGYTVASTPGQFYEQGEEVLNQCYDSLAGVQVSGPTTNAWVGSVLLSRDGGETWSPFACADCSGTVVTTDPVTVDGNSDGGNDFTANCLGGKQCTLTEKGGGRKRRLERM